MSILAVAISNSAWGAGFAAFWQQPWALEFGNLGLRMPALDWINHGLLSVFFLDRRTRGQARIHGGPPRERAIRGDAGRRRARRDDRARRAVRAGDSRRDLGARMGRADGDRHRLRGCADRLDGPARAGGTAHLPDGGDDRRRHRRHLGHRAVLQRRNPRRVPRRRRGRRRRARAAEPFTRLSRVPVPAARRRALGVRARRGPARDACRRDPRTLHPHAAAA